MGVGRGDRVTALFMARLINWLLLISAHTGLETIQAA